MTSQDLILDAIASAIAKRDDIVLIRDGQYANTGTLRTLERTTLRQIAALPYNFQREGCDFGPMGSRIASLDYDHPERGTAPFVQRSIPDLVAAVTTYLTTTERNP